MNRYDALRGVTGDPPKYPDIPLSFEDTYVVSTEGDRFDILAQQFHITPGTQIRIPSNPADVIQRYRGLNSL